MVMASSIVQIGSLRVGALISSESAVKGGHRRTVPVPRFHLPAFLHSADSLNLQKWQRFSTSTHRKGVKGLKGLMSTQRRFSTRAIYVDDDEEGYLVDAPVSVGDGFSFSGGNYSDDVGRGAQWFNSGKIAKAYPVEGGLEKAKDPVFGLPMGEASQTSTDFFRWFYVEEGDRNKPSVLLLHGFPSQAYSYRTVIQLLSADHHVVAFDWLEYAAGLALLVDALDLKSFTLVVQGYFAPAVVQFAKENLTKVDHLILVNPPSNMQNSHQHCQHSRLSFLERYMHRTL